MNWLRKIDLNDLLKIAIFVLALSIAANTVYIIVSGK